MNEIEKLYENGEIKKKRMCEWTCRGNEFCSTNCEHYESTKEFYPPFTAEKQLELIKFLFNHNVYYDVDEKGNYWFHISDEIENSKYREFDEATAECINKMWQDLTEEEKEQIRSVLE